MFLRFIILISFLLIAATSLAQERCGTVAYEKMLHQKNSKRETIDQFEKWMQNKLNQKKSAPLSTQRAQTTYTIPIVIHVIHNGEAIGTGLNISDAQILSQIKVLNDDFNRLNADQTNTPAIFQSVAGSFDIQFVLAQQDPNGLATNGIVRVKGSQSSWTFGNNYLLKSQSYWPAEQYLNVWVTNLTDFLGYTQLPVSSQPGLEDSSNERLTDGIVINHQAFGTADAGNFSLKPQYNKGRTLTHEMGHFFGLRHIWGDYIGTNPCLNSTDYVTDTPIQDSETAGCPAHPQTNCSSIKMFQNYLDYSNDACMNIFTQGQVARMNTIIQNSPRRMELPNSPGSQPPTSVNNDLGIKTILSPAATACSGLMMPSIIVRNYGTNAITSAQIQFKKNGSIVETKGISSSLSINAEQQIDFAPISLSSSTSYSFEFLIISTNSGTDGNGNNNLKSITTVTPSIGTLPLIENFSPFPSTWSINNPDGLVKWEPSSPSSKSAMFIDFYNYTELGAVDKLVTPLLDLTTATSATLIFDRAYATYPGITGERFRVLASTACRFDNSPVVLFDKSDKNLETAPSTTSAFIPTSTQWVTEVIPLTQFFGQSVQLAFEGTNANGNNLYVSNVKIITGTFLDLALEKLESPSPVSCQSNPAPSIRVKNNGNVAITSFTVSTTFNGGSVQTQNFSNLSIGLNDDQVFQLNSIALAAAVNQYTVSLSNPNGAVDVNSPNNSGAYSLVFSNARDIIPLRERFDSNSQLNWTIVSQGQQQLWTKASTNYSNSLFYNSFTNSNIGDESWLVSPILDLSKTTKGSVFFDVSYAPNPKGVERLRLMASKDCGATFNDVLFDESGGLLSNTLASPPDKTSDWKKNFVKLDDWVGNSAMRFAFVVNNGNGNNLYLDNIDFFIDDTFTQVFPESSYSVYGGIDSHISMTFNLEERQLVNVQIYNSIGQVIVDYPLPETLNQTYQFNLGERGVGIYIVRVQVGNQLSAKKVFVGN